MSEIKKWIKKYWYPVFMISAVIGLAIFIVWDNGEKDTQQKFINTSLKTLEDQGFEIKDVEINSPTIYIRYDTIDAFLKAAKENNQTVFYKDLYNRLYFFNEDYTVDHKKWIGYESVKEWMDTQE